MTLPDPVKLAIPLFVLLVVVEAIWAWRQGRDVYETLDTAASLVMGLGNFGFGLAYGGIIAVASAWAYKFRLFEIGFAWWAFALVFLLEDLVYYWFHRLSHEHRVWWAAHVNHHTSQHYNLSTALRQTWTGNLALTWTLWLVLVAIGFPPALVAFQKGVSLVYQFWIHTEAIRRLPPWVEAIFNTPSHHRVHHATNPRYLDRNYAGILIVWDKLFGTFVPEDDREPCRYGIVKNIGTFNPLRIAFHEWADIAKDVARAKSWRERLMLVFGPPGWRADGAGLTSERIRAFARENDDRASSAS